MRHSHEVTAAPGDVILVRNEQGERFGLCEVTEDGLAPDSRYVARLQDQVRGAFEAARGRRHAIWQAGNMRRALCAVLAEASLPAALREQVQWAVDNRDINGGGAPYELPAQEARP